jgi:hypothetical protein
MSFRIQRLLVLLTCFCLLFIAAGCAPKTYRAHPEFEMRAKNIKTQGLITPDVKVYELTAGGVQELRDDWCGKGKENVSNAIAEMFKGKPIEIKPLATDKDIEEEMEDIQALYRAVITSIHLHTYGGPYTFPEKQKNFDYSIGSVDEVLKRYGSDALIFVYGFDEISTSGRKALTAAGILVGAFTGVVITPRAGITALNIAVVDPSGAILWYNSRGSQGGHDLRDHDSCASLVEDILSDYPPLKK